MSAQTDADGTCRSVGDWTLSTVTGIGSEETLAICTGMR